MPVLREVDSVYQELNWVLLYLLYLFAYFWLGAQAYSCCVLRVQPWQCPEDHDVVLGNEPAWPRARPRPEP